MPRYLQDYNGNAAVHKATARFYLDVENKLLRRMLGSQTVRLEPSL